MNSPYFDFVQSLRPRWPAVGHLVKYMRSNSHHSSRIAVLNFENGGVRLNGLFEVVDDFPPLLNENPNKMASRLVIVEDPSVQVIEFLGNHFDIDPEFFSMHVVNHHWYGLRSGRETIPSSKATIREGSFLRFRYLTARPTRERKPSEEDKTWDKTWYKTAMTTKVNVKRKVTVMKLKSVERHLIGFLRQHLSVWMRKVGDDHWLGIAISF